MMSDQQITEAITLARRGNQGEARQLFVQILEQQPCHELAWLWLGRILPDLVQRRYCLERVLKINPDNIQARQAIDVLSVLEELGNAVEPQQPLMRTVGGSGRVRRIGDFLVDMGFVHRDVVERIALRQASLRREGKEFSLGNLLLDASLITHEQLYSAVHEQEIAYQSCFT